MKISFTLLLTTFAIVLCITPGFAAIQWAGTHVIDLDAETLSLGAFSSWTNAGTPGGTFAADPTSPEPGNITVADYNRGENNIDKKAVAINNLNTDNRRPANGLLWSLTTTNLFGGVTSSFTVEMWVYDDQFSNYEALGGFERRDPVGGGGWMSFWSGGSAAGDDTARLVYGGGGGVSGFLGTPNPRQNPAGGKFNYYAYVYDTVNGGVKVYVNGIQVQTIAWAPAFAVNNGKPVNFGGYGRDDASPLNRNIGGGPTCSIAKVRVHGGALSALQVYDNFAEEAQDFMMAAAMPERPALEPVYDGPIPQTFTATAGETTVLGTIYLVGPGVLSPPDTDLTWSLDGEPVGITINSANGMMTVANTVAVGVYSFTVDVINLVGSESISVEVDVQAAGAAVLSGDVIDLDPEALGIGPVVNWPNAAVGAASVGHFTSENRKPEVIAFETNTGGTTKVLRFNGQNQCALHSANTATTQITGTNPWSVETWAFVDTIPFEQWILHWSHRGTDSRCAAVGYGTSGGWGVFGGWAGGDMGWGTTAPVVKVWHHIVLTYEGGAGGDLTCWVDGVQKNQATKSLNLFSGADAMRVILGAQYGGGAPYASAVGDAWPFNGKLGLLRMFSRQLSEAEVLQNYNAQKDQYTPKSYTISASAGPGGTIEPDGDSTVYDGDSITYTITPNIGYGIEDVLVDTVSQGAIDTYEFTNVVDDHTISVTFSELPKSTVSGTVTDGADPIPGAVIYFNPSPNASQDWSFVVQAGPGGTFSAPIPAGTWYVCASASTCLTSADLAPIVLSGGTPLENVDFVLEPNGRNIPAKKDLLFSVVTEAFDAIAGGNPTGAWPLFHPLGPSLTTVGSPQVEEIEGLKWEQNVYADNDGYRRARYAAPIICSGVSIVAVVKPVYAAVGGEPRGEIVDIFYDRLALAVAHADGRLMVARNFWNDWGPVIPNGQKTILSLVVQTDGSYKAYVNGSEAMTGDADGDWTSIDPNHFATWGADPDYTHYVNVGRNDPDGWSTFSGKIGDVFVYTTALSDVDRQTLEADLADKFGVTGLPATPTPPANTPTPRPPTSGITDWSMFE